MNGSTRNDSTVHQFADVVFVPRVAKAAALNLNTATHFSLTAPPTKGTVAQDAQTSPPSKESVRAICSNGKKAQGAVNAITGKEVAKVRDGTEIMLKEAKGLFKASKTDVSGTFELAIL